MTAQHRATLLAAAVGLILSNVASAEVTPGFYFGLTLSLSGTPFETELRMGTR